MGRVIAILVLLAVIVTVFAWGPGRQVWARALLAARVLDGLRNLDGDSWLTRATDAPVEEGTRLVADGRSFATDLYRPARGGGEPLLLVPGAVELGKDDPRVPPFARLLARAGFLVAVPDLPSFRTLSAHPENPSELAAALAGLARRPDLAPHGSAGVFGISYAGGIALLAAADPALADRVRFVATVGAHADLDTVVRFLATGQVAHEGRLLRLRSDPYGRLVFLKTYEEFLESEEDRALLAEMAERRIRDPGAWLEDLARPLGPAGRLLYDLFETARPEEVPDRIARLPDGMKRRMADLSPARHDLSALRARLYLVHDREDGTIPFTETLRLAALARPHAKVRTIVLESLHHVDPEPWRKDPWGFLTRDLPEALRLGAWWFALLGERRG